MNLLKRSSIIIILISFFISGILVPQSVLARGNSMMFQGIDGTKQRSTNEIEIRVDNLRQLIPQVNARKNLTIEQKAQFVSEIQSEIDKLQELKNNILVEGDQDVLGINIMSVSDSYRFYALFRAKIRIIAASDLMDGLINKLENVSLFLHEQILKDNNSGSLDVVSTYNRLISKLDDARNQSKSAFSTVISLEPSEYPNNMPQLASAREMIKSGSNSIKAAQSDMRRIIKTLN